MMEFFGRLMDGGDVDPVVVEHAENVFNEHAQTFRQIGVKAFHECVEEGLTFDETIECVSQLAWMSGFCTGRMQGQRPQINGDN
jgi:hypothetical protein